MMTSFNGWRSSHLCPFDTLTRLTRYLLTYFQTEILMSPLLYGVKYRSILGMVCISFRAYYTLGM